jgi:hypothetical protein
VNGPKAGHPVSIDDFCPTSNDRGHETRNVFDVVLVVRVEDEDVGSLGRLNPGADSRTLATVALVVNLDESGVLEVRKQTVSTVRRAVVNHDDF